jgi:hypothetical protein
MGQGVETEGEMGGEENREGEVDKGERRGMKCRMNK